MNVFSVKSPGAYTTVQDAGRVGYQKMGVPVSGSLDHYSYRAANMMIGNPPGAAALEITITGPILDILSEADMVLTGADMKMTLNGDIIPTWKTFHVKPGDELAIHQIRKGCRAYLAVTGGIDVPLVMGSRSTYPGGGIGGFHGRPLKAGDMLSMCGGPFIDKCIEIPEHLKPVFDLKVKLRVIPGPQDDYFDQGMDTLLNSEYMVTPKADRMGYRLMGPKIHIKEGFPKSIISEPSMPGGIQIPADEQPIVLFVEQTVGGYCKIATVISTDLPKLAQATPGDAVIFERTDLSEAQKAYKKLEERLAEIARLA